jgi:hypothetical protein
VIVPASFFVLQSDGAAGQIQADWGLHLVDFNIAMGNLVETVGERAKTWLKR